MKNIKRDSELSIEIKEHQQKITDLENKIMSFHKQLKDIDLGKALDLKMERKTLFNKLSELEKIKYDIETKTKLAIENIELGMTHQEVKSLI